MAYNSIKAYMTITIKDFMEAVSYRITDGAEYCWQCYGPNARSLDYWNEEHNNGVTITIVFDTKTQIVYQMEAWDYAKNREYRWIHPSYRDAIEAESKRRNIDFAESIDGNKFIDLDVTDDILEKATAMANGEEYDDRVLVPIDLSDEQLLAVMKLAHEADLTFNKFVEQILRKEIARIEKQVKNSVDGQITWPPLSDFIV